MGIEESDKKESHDVRKHGKLSNKLETTPSVGEVGRGEITGQMSNKLGKPGYWTSVQYPGGGG
jgi:hypothetical protein